MIEKVEETPSIFHEHIYALNPSSIKTPLTAKGNPSFRLEKLAELNNLPVEFAHDAYSDVKKHLLRLLNLFTIQIQIIGSSYLCQ